ncbi:MAG: hypothetical protein A2722_01645 [Candidatus Doudnabacteria bacterium RIFCSPHIGHO2_01_FULL_50_11]|uniref:GGDEF domain-containing protein n=1 Tax=Candidatus Doudnabacteria bacterium RIFCSPHIGHO2_01_FULL_50_11 TaxID=1817828 RepID=A0A1F5PEY9_9BACT|nr:MAG: hypothetical protein A2722_01645 [Candidatus Doudnabacteria bacterium RIFCSPHIGHO2_01_FULL_50_11]HLC44312.1 GGDEF domain-containing protein [Patescibacteria group bacterium]
MQDILAEKVARQGASRNFWERLLATLSGFGWVVKCVWILNANPLATAEIDELTRVYTRDHALALARHELEMARRYKLPFSIVFLDVDGLKNLNDMKGHAAGNRLLREMGTRLKSSQRLSDIIGRYGGDEFIIVLPQTGFESAREYLKRMQIDCVQVPFSFGIASEDWGSEKSTTLESLISSADCEMYYQKRARKLAAAKS